MLCALVNDDKVIGVEELTEEKVTELARTHQMIVDVSNYQTIPKIGWCYNRDGTVSEFPGNPPLKKLVTKLAFRNRFTIQELTAMYAAAKTNPLLEVLLDNLRVSTFIDLQRTDTISGVMLLAQLQLLTVDRANAILGAPVTELERYHEG